MIRSSPFVRRQARRAGRVVRADLHDHAAGTAGAAAADLPDRVRIALVVASVAAIFGALPIAMLVAAFAIPVVYVVYLYDVNLGRTSPSRSSRWPSD